MSASTVSAPTTRTQAQARLALLAAALAGILAILAFLVAWLLPTGPLPWRVEYPLAALEVGVPRNFRPVELGRDAAGRPTWIWLVRQPDGTVDAFWSRTARRSDCSVAVRLAERRDGRLSSLSQYLPAGVDAQWLFRTPCHGSTFALDGTRLLGPAPRGLDSFPTRVRGDAVLIDVTRIIRGQCGSVPARTCSLPDETVAERFYPGD